MAAPISRNARDRIDWMLEKLRSHPATNDLLERAEKVKLDGKTGPWKIVLKGHEKMKFPGSCNSSSRVIKIDRSQTDEKAIAFLIFELLNATQAPLSNQIDKYRFGLTANQYAEYIEAVEYDNSLEHAKIIDATGWGDDYNLYKESEGKTFHDYWFERRNCFNSHADYYRRCYYCFTAPAIYNQPHRLKMALLQDKLALAQDFLNRGKDPGIEHIFAGVFKNVDELVECMRAHASNPEVYSLFSRAVYANELANNRVRNDSEQGLASFVRQAFNIPHALKRRYFRVLNAVESCLGTYGKELIKKICISRFLNRK